jgi:hypothetical protein
MLDMKTWLASLKKLNAAKIRPLRKIAPTVLRHPAVFLGRKDYIFVVSHIRSYSSLLCHILGSHEEIAGYGEMNQAYSGWTDLLQLKYKVYKACDDRLEGRFVLDKVLHDYYPISKKILRQNNVKLIYLLRRDPEKTLKSIIRMERNLGHPWADDMKAVLYFYLNGLQAIQRCLAKSNGNTLFFDSEKLLEETDVVLNGLADWLGLKTRLTPEYSQFKLTGKPHFGDPSDFIKKGELVRTAKDYSDIHIPAPVVKQASEAYQACRGALLLHTDTIL